MRSLSKAVALLLAMILMAAALGGCVPGQKKETAPTTPTTPTTPAATASGPKTGGIFRTYVFNPTSLDPAFWTWGSHITRMGLLEGLVRYDAKLQAAPAVAEKWESNADKTVWKFSLRKNAKWSNGDPVTAKDFEYSLKRVIDPATSAGGSGSYQGNAEIKNAEQFRKGEIKDINQVGVKALDDYTLEITLAKGNATFPIRLAEPWAMPAHKATVEKFGKDFIKPGNYVSNGPFMLKSWTINTDMELVRNPNYWGKVYLDGVKMMMTAANVIAYESNEVDMVEVGAQDIDRILKDPNLSKELTQAPTGTLTSFFNLRSANPIMEDIRVRQALAMSFDRDKIVKAVGRGTVGAAYSTVPPVVATWSKEVGLGYDVAKAKKLMADAGYPDGKGFPEMTLMVSYQGDVDPVIMAVVDEWKNNLGIKVKVDNAEWGLHTKNRIELLPKETAGFFTNANNAGFPGLSAYFAGLFDPNDWGLKGAQWGEFRKLQTDPKIDASQRAKLLEDFKVANASPEAKQYKDLLDKAGKETDAAKQEAIYKEAAKLRDSLAYVIPISYINSVRLIKPYVKGYAPNAFLLGHPLYWNDLWLDK